uniref:AIG1-type G domain-containing protein n=1 Tax=Amphimedon queenslandica TaxID=400682 RepID=A0A1X7UKH4_AMPQE
MSVLLIGSTGMGKSTFGNFLIDPDDTHMYDRQTFPAATNNRPKTQEVKVASKHFPIEGSDRKMELKLIDTPGLNESATKDLSHMIDIIKKLNECQEIRAFILVVKFNAKIDAQYRATMEYYSKLLPGLFEKNVIIVLTDYATDERSVKQRERQCIDVEEIKRNTILELGQCSNNQITYSPQLFMIDCQPMTSAEKEISKKERKAILDYIFQLTPIEVRNQMVAKTDYIKQKDAQKYEQLQGEIKGYSERLQEVNKESKNALDQTRHKNREITEIESKIHDLKKQLEDKDTTGEIVAVNCSINEEWKWFQWQTREFNIESQHEISSHTKWTNGNCQFKEIVQKPDAINGRIEGSFMRGIHASITAYTQKKIKYAKEIEDLKKKIETKNKILTECKDEWEKYRAEQKESLEEIELLEKYIAQRRVVAEKCRSNLMTMEDAATRLEELKGERFDD